MKTIKELSELHSRVALITGGAGYLGQTMAEALAEAGASIIILDHDSERASNIVDNLSNSFGGKHYGMVVDLTSKEAISSVPCEIEEQFGRLDILINCAALVGSDGLTGWAVDFMNQEVETWEKALAVNMTAPFYLIQKCLPLLRQSGSGSIINVGSLYGVAGQKTSMYEGLNYITPAAYSASKGGLTQLTKYLATVLAPDVRVNTISPGGIERGQDRVFKERYEALTPLGRMAHEEDFKGVTLFLASDLSSYITGQNIVIDGGWSL